MSVRSKVLIADDQEANRHTVASVIEHLDVELFFADSGAEALSLVLEHQFSVILMDVHMPGMDGIEATRLIRGRRLSKDVPIVMLTASNSDGELLLSAYDAGAVDYMAKPFVPIILINKVRQFVELERQRQFVESARKEQAETNSRLQVLLSSAGEGIIGIDLTGNITFANPKAAAILNMNQSSLLQGHIKDVITADSAASPGWKTSSLCRCLSMETGGHCDDEQWQRREGSAFDVEYTCEPMKDASDKVIGAVVMFQNISRRKAIEKNLIYLANYDPLTNLTNRGYFHDNLQKAIARSKRSKTPLSVLMLDLDHFKYINDTYGHDGGDQLLQIVSARLVSSIRDGDVVARLGGDEFAVILYDIKNVSDATAVAQKIIEAVSEDIDFQVGTVNISCSIGISLFDDYSLEMHDVIKHADTALYEAKEQGRNNYQVFVPNMRDPQQNLWVIGGVGSLPSA